MSENQTIMSENQTTTHCQELCYRFTELILFVYGIITILSVVLALGVAVLGVSRIHKGLDYFTKSYHEQWDNSTFFL